MAIMSPLKILEKGIEKSRFRLAQVAAQRAKMMLRGAKPLVETSFSKPITIALQEIYEGKVSYYSSEDAALIRDELTKRDRESEDAEIKAIQEKENLKAKTAKEAEKDE
jgi:DNA-directed RNA polymerase subunit omega